MFRKLFSRKLWVTIGAAITALASGNVEAVPVIGAIYVAAEGIVDAAGALLKNLKGED